MKKHFWWMSVALWLPLQAAAQDGRFHSPVDIPFLMSGSFGEPRPNHFHCGIDVKTQGVVGKRVLSVYDGYCLCTTGMCRGLRWVTTVLAMPFM